MGGWNCDFFGEKGDRISLEMEVPGVWSWTVEKLISWNPWCGGGGDFFISVVGFAELRFATVLLRAQKKNQEKGKKNDASTHRPTPSPPFF